MRQEAYAVPVIAHLRNAPGAVVRVEMPVTDNVMQES